MTTNHSQIFNKGHQRQSKFQAVLDEAAILFNANGYSGTTLDELATRLNLTKSALYYYVKSKEDLGLQSYRRTLEIQLKNIQEADRAGHNGLEKIVSYLRFVCQRGDPPFAILDEVAALNREVQDELITGSRDNAHKLRQFVELGVKDGSITPCDPVLVTLAINGLLSWIPQWCSEGGEQLEAVGEVIIDILVNGLHRSRGREEIAGFLHDMEISKPPQDVFDRKAQAHLKREALLKTATHSFNQRGVSGTSLDAIVRSLNVTKGAFYYYVSSKDDLLFQCYARTLDLTQNLLDRADQRGDNGWNKLELAARAIINLHCGAEGPIAIFSGVTALSPERRVDISDRVSKVYQTTIRFIEEGFVDGSIRRCALLPTFGVLVGSAIWLPKWYSAEGPRNPKQIGDAFSNLFAYGLKVRNT